MCASRAKLRPEFSELEAILSETAFTRHYGFRLGSISEGECRLEIPFQPLFERPGGVVGGQVYMAAADVAAWLAIKTVFGVNDKSVTIGQNTQFLSSVRNADFICVARIERAGDRLIFLSAECQSAVGKLVSLHTLTYLNSNSS